MPIWKLFQTRWIRESTLSNSNLIGEFGRKREANGQAKHQLKSHMEMMLKHDHYPDLEAEVDWDNYSLTFSDDKGIVYKIQYEVQGVEE